MKPLPVDVLINSLLASCFLLASTVLAAPPRSQQHNILERDDPPGDTVAGFMGILWQDAPGSFDFVHGNFKVPDFPLNVDSSLTVAITLDAVTYDPDSKDIFFEVGVTFRVRNGSLYIQGFTQWGRGHYLESLDVSMSSDDWIQLTLLTYDNVTGYASIDNLNTPFGTYSRANITIYQPDYPLYGRSGGWIALPESGAPVIRTNVTILGASVGKAHHYYYGPYGGTEIYLIDNTVSTGFSADNSSLNITITDRH